MKESSTAVARLRRRMTAYRGRSQEQEIRQQERDKVQQQETTVGFNLFCLEFAKKIVPQSREVFTNSTAPSPLEGFPLSSSSSLSSSPPLCWMCGELHPSPASLNQHAIDIHFPEWLSACVVWGTYLDYW